MHQSDSIYVINLRQLRTFIAVADRLNFREAALELNTDQSSVSRQLARLETEIGTRLFHRDTRRVQLSTAGAAFLSGVRPAVLQLEEAHRAACRASRGEQGTLLIAHNQSGIHRAYSLVMRDFKAIYPEVETTLEPLSGEMQMQAIVDGRIDVGFSLRPLANPKTGIASLRLFIEPIVAAMPRSHRLARFASVNLQDLSSEPLFVADSSIARLRRRRILAEFRRLGFSPQLSLGPKTAEAILELVKVGAGIALVPQQLEHLGSGEVVYRPIGDWNVTVEHVAVWRKSNRSAALACFLKFLRGQVLPHGVSDHENP
jgi:DNA-binding transcriptional LysR family regulator